MTTGPTTWTEQSLTKVFQAAAEQMTAYAGLLPFFENLYKLQESAVAVADPPSPAPRHDLGEAHGRDRLPLIQRGRMPIDWPAAQRLLAGICSLARQANPKLAAGARNLNAELEHDGDALTRAYAAMLEEHSADFGKLADRLDISPEIYAFLLYNSIWPSLCRSRRHLVPYLASDRTGIAGNCPICGSSPSIAILDENGARLLVCSFCRHQWSALRSVCPFCEHRPAEGRRYYFCEEQKAYRVHTCEHCGAYLKTIDSRELRRLCYPPLEAILTHHLDIKAQQLGFRSLAPIWQAL